MLYLEVNGKFCGFIEQIHNSQTGIKPPVINGNILSGYVFDLKYFHILFGLLPVLQPPTPILVYLFRQVNIIISVFIITENQGADCIKSPAGNFQEFQMKNCAGRSRTIGPEHLAKNRDHVVVAVINPYFKA